MIRRAEIKDIDSLNRLLYQVQTLHAEKRPDIFKLGAKKYTSQELARIIADDMTPIFVYEEEGVVIGVAAQIADVAFVGDKDGVQLFFPEQGAEALNAVVGHSSSWRGRAPRVLGNEHDS